MTQGLLALLLDDKWHATAMLAAKLDQAPSRVATRLSALQRSGFVESKLVDGGELMWRQRRFRQPALKDGER